MSTALTAGGPGTPAPLSLCTPCLRAWRHITDLRLFVLVGWLMEDDKQSLRSVWDALQDRDERGDLPDDITTQFKKIAALPKRLHGLFESSFGRPVDLYRRGYGQNEGLTADGVVALRLAEAYLRHVAALQDL